MSEVFNKLARGAIKIRKALETHMQGEQRALFKGSGLAFDDVRPYQYGDDVRRIHWSVSSKGHGVYVKTFREEREQVVFFLVDVSASQQIGTGKQQKINLAREVCGTLMLSAIHDSSQVGMLLFSDEVEHLIKPKKGIYHAHRLIHSLYQGPIQSDRTQIAKALRHTIRLFRRSIVLIVISDFIDHGYMSLMKDAAARYDLILLHLQSAQEARVPQLGILPFYEPETRQVRWCNTRSHSFRRQFEDAHQDRIEVLRSLARAYRSDYLQLSLGEDYLPRLIDLFRQRNLRRCGR